MKKIFVASIAAAGFLGFSIADSIALDKVKDARGIADRNYLEFINGAATFYDSSRMSDLAESLRRVEQGDKIKITPSHIDLVTRRMLSVTTEYTVVNAPDQNDLHLTIQVKPRGSDTTKTINFENWKQFILNDRGVNFEPKRI